MTLLDCYMPVFKLGTQLLEQTNLYDDYDSFRHRCTTCIEQAVTEAEYQDVSEFERDQALFAIVVWFDETVLCSTLPFAHIWRTDLLQRRYFQTSIGGEEFFGRLHELQEEHNQVRVVFLFCLLNGYYGKYSTERERLDLYSLIDKQREYCLPEAWQTWPNDASITPIEIKKRSFSSSAQSRIGRSLLFIGIIYGAIYFFQTLNFS